MKLLAAILSLSFLFAVTVPAATAAPHSRVKSSKRRAYKVKRAKVHRATVHKSGH